MKELPSKTTVFQSNFLRTDSRSLPSGAAASLLALALVALPAVAKKDSSLEEHSSAEPELAGASEDRSNPSLSKRNKALDKCRSKECRNEPVGLNGDRSRGRYVHAPSDEELSNSLTPKALRDAKNKHEQETVQFSESATMSIRNFALDAFEAPGFTANGNQIIDPDGNVFVPKGINVFPWNLTERDQLGIDECWNFNLVRLHSWILPRMTTQWKDHIVYVDEPLIYDPAETDLRQYDLVPMIEAYTSRDIVVVVDIHDLIGKYFMGAERTDYLRFLEHFAIRFKDNPYVWIDIHNEPGAWEGRSGDYTEWRSQMSVAMDTIRAAAPDMMMWLSGTAWGQDSGPSWNSSIVPDSSSALLANADLVNSYDNLVLTFHAYDQWQFSRERLDAYLDSLAALNKPVIVGEYGFSINNNNVATPGLLHDLLREPQHASVGRVAWTWSAMDGNDLVAANDGSGYWVDSCDAPTNLTDFGSLIWNDNHGLVAE